MTFNSTIVYSIYGSPSIFTVTSSRYWLTSIWKKNWNRFIRTYPREIDLLKATFAILKMGWCHYYDDILYQHEKRFIDAKILYVLKEAFCMWTVWNVGDPKNWIRKTLFVINAYIFMHVKKMTNWDIKYFQKFPGSLRQIQWEISSVTISVYVSMHLSYLELLRS